MYDVAIIGAGPAGTAAAYDLLTAGLTVLLLDKVEFPRKKACAGGITPKGIRLFRYDISPVVKRVCRSVRITPQNSDSFLIKDDNPLCYMTKREELDFFSLNMVIEKGALFKVVKKVEDIEESGSHVEIRTGSASFKARYLIGADGANSVVRRFVAGQSFFQKQMAVEADVRIANPERVSMEFDFSRFPRGYYWIFPKTDHVNIGIYSVNADEKPGIGKLREFAKNRLGTDRLEAVKGYPICTNGFQYRPQSGRILLAGDAAGLAERLLGEGIYFAVASGQKAAAAINESERFGKFPAGHLYQRKLSEIQTDLKLYGLSSRWFYCFPHLSLKALAVPFVRKPFVRGYAKGNTLSRILSFRSPAGSVGPDRA